MYTLTTVQQSKFSKEEKKFILKQALTLCNIPESDNIGKIEYMYKSNNMFFFIAKEPNCTISKNLMRKIQDRRSSCSNKVTEQLCREENFVAPLRAPNLYEYLIARDKALNLGDIQTIALDILRSLH